MSSPKLHDSRRADCAWQVGVMTFSDVENKVASTHPGNPCVGAPEQICVNLYTKAAQGPPRSIAWGRQARVHRVMDGAPVKWL